MAEEGSDQRGARRFLRAWLLVLVLLGAVVFPSVTLLTLDFSSSSEAFWVDQLYARKLRAVELRRSADQGPMLLTFGGSAGLFGINAQMLEGHLGKPAVNFNTHGALGLDYHLARIRRVARRGDTALLVLETSMPFKDPAISENLLKETVWTYDRRYLAEASARRLLEFLYLNRFKDYATSVELRLRRARGERVRPKGAAGLYGYLQLSPNGDFAGSPPAVDFASTTNRSAEVHPGARAALKKLVAWCDSNGVHLRLAAAGVCAPEPADAQRRAQQYAAADALFRDLGVEVWGSAAESEYPRELFIDTPLHFIPAGRRIYTERVLETRRRLAGLPAAEPQVVYLLHRDSGEIALPARENGSAAISRSYYVSPERLAHPSCIAAGDLPDFLRQTLQRVPVYLPDPVLVSTLTAAGFTVAETERREASLAEWHRRHPRGIFLLARAGTSGLPFALENLPPALRAAIENDDFSAAVAGPGLLKRAAAREPLAVRVEASAARPFAFEILLRSGAPEEFSAGESPITVNGEPIGTAQAGVAVAVLDPSTGIVVEKGTFTSERILEGQLFRVTSP